MGPTPLPSSPWPPRPLPTPNQLEQASFTLRLWRPTDAAQLSAAWADESIRRWTNPPEATIEGARRWIAGCKMRRAEGLALDLVIDVDGDVAGEVGLSSFDPDRRAALVGYWVAVSHRGDGLGAKATRAVAGWFHTTLGGAALLAQCDPENVASHRTAERAGFSKLGVHDSELVYVSVPVVGH